MQGQVGLVQGVWEAACSCPAPTPALGASGRKHTLPHGRHTYRVADGVAAAWKHGKSREGSKS